MDPGLTGKFFFGKSSQNCPKPVLIFWNSIPWVFYIYIAKSCWLLLFECSVHVSDGFPKKKFGWGVDGWGEVYPSFFGIFFNFAKPLTTIPLFMISLCLLVPQIAPLIGLHFSISSVHDMQNYY